MFLVFYPAKNLTNKIHIPFHLDYLFVFGSLLYAESAWF
jgi:hypothetical protein